MSSKLDQDSLDKSKESISEKGPGTGSKKSKNIMIFSGMAIQMGAVIGLFAWLGTVLDKKYQFEKPIWTIVLSLSGVFISLYLLIKQAKKLSDDS